MKHVTRTRATLTPGAASTVAAGILRLVFLVLPVLALAAVPSGKPDAQASPSLASLRVEIWPEFDRRKAALVILKGELAPDVSLPMTVSLRIPASSGGPTAVAFSEKADGELFNLAHEKTNAADFITLRLQAPQRYFHVEFYDPLAALEPDRRYAYVWPGDLAVSKLSARLQQPAGASGFSAQPELGTESIAPDGLRYWTAELGAVTAGKRFPIEIRYAKTDPRTTAEILGLKTAEVAPAASTARNEGFPWWLLIFVVTLALTGVTGVGAVVWWRRRKDALAARASSAGFCSQCGASLGAGDRFCAACGTKVRRK